ncbi:TonB-dependent siderophore receptor [Shewanella intestini]|uniref:TonB-dependent siderophore receptor n=1 Tax=Shewanella intestini TaxID=2017544 RepID=A0ABS5I451_9GAMM|nr:MULTISPECIES: TonB-dependent siderophore receptor [Shewanella]MBR9728801.1 TonB-dependent siderophore receptor [Shewanella intestini]MRG36876.1 TonB-dependent siderophore receptor [Shewanella sp. XMDDZSB0408]
MISISDKKAFPLTLMAASIGAAMVFSAQTNASENNDTADATIETITVLGQAYRNTATKTSLTPLETPQGVTVIDGELLSQRGVSSLNQALRYVPGVTTEQKGGAVTMYDTFNLRGFDVNQSYYDGLVLQSLKGWNLQPQIDPIALEQVEVFKGPTSVLYGSMPPGGMVNMIAKTPQTTSATSVNVATGNQNLVEASIDTTGQFGDSDFSYRVIGLARSKDGQVDHTQEKRYVFAPSVDWNVSDDTYINVNLYYQKDPAMGMNSSLPSAGMIYDNPNGSTSASTLAGDKNWSAFEREFVLAGYKLNHSFNDNWSFLQNFRYMDANLSQKNTYHLAANFDPITGNLDRNIYSTDESSSGFTVDNQLSGLIHTGNIEHNLLLGVDYQKMDGDSLYSEFGTTSQFGDFNIFNPNNDMIDPSKLTVSTAANDKVKVEQTGVYFQNQMRANNLIVIVGGRYDDYRSSSHYAYDGGSTDNGADQQQFSYRVGAMYEFANGIAPFASYATSFEPVEGTKTDGSTYQPEMGDQLELGLKYASEDQSKTASVSLFNIVKSDALMANPDDPWGDKLQVGEIESRGAEFEGKWFMTDNVDVAVNYTYIDMEITKDSGNGLQGTQPIYVPKNAASLWANYQIDDGKLAGVRVSGGVRYVGDMQMDALNSAKVSAYTLADLSVGYDLGEFDTSLLGASINLAANNLFNKDYYTCYDTANCWYGAERTVKLSVNYQF